MTVQNRPHHGQTPAATTLEVSLGDRSYPIEVGRGVLARAAELFAPVLRQNRVFIVTDSNVAPLYLAPLEKHLSAAGIRSDHAILPAGEAAKDFATTLHAIAEPGQHLATPVEQIIAASGGVAQPGPTLAEALAKLPPGPPARVLVCGSLYLAGEVLKADAAA